MKRKLNPEYGILDIAETLLFDLEESHQEEIKNEHYGDRSCSYCDDIAEAKIIIARENKRRD